MSTIYRGLDLDTAQVAIKVIRTATPRGLERFARAARILVELGRRLALGPLAMADTVRP